MGWIQWLIDWIRRHPQPSPPDPPLPVPSDWQQQLLASHNSVRSQHGLPPLTLNVLLCKSAQREAGACNRLGRLDHNADGTPWSRISSAGYKYSDASENIAEGQTAAAEVVSDWLGDPAHASNVLGRWKDAGFGRSANYWCADYANPS